MAQAKLEEKGGKVEAAVPRAAVGRDQEAVDELTVDRILETGIGIGAGDGDPVRGIRNALVASAAIWVTLAAALIVAS